MYSNGPNKHVHTPIYSQKKSHPHAFFRFEIFPQICISTHKSRTKYPIHTFIQDHTVIWATRVLNEVIEVEKTTYYYVNFSIILSTV